MPSHECPVHSLDREDTEPLFGTTRFYEFACILSGCCAVFTFVATVWFQLKHATRISKPREQIRILRISILLPIYGVTSLICAVYPGSKVYIDPWLEVVQAFALGTFFPLLLEFIAPSHEAREAFFAEHTIRRRWRKPKNGLAYFRRRYVLIYQYPPIAVLMALMANITHAVGVYCPYETKYYWAKIWITVIVKTSLVVAIITIVFFCSVMRPQILGQRAFAKLFSFKMVVALSFIQSALFQLLEGRGALNTTPKITFADLNMGIPSLVTAIEMLPICFFFLWAFSYKPYIIPSADSGDDASASVRSYQGGTWGLKALMEMWSPMDLVHSHVLAWRIFRAKTYLDGTSVMHVAEELEEMPPPAYEAKGRVKVAVEEKVKRVDSSSTT